MSKDTRAKILKAIKKAKYLVDEHGDATFDLDPDYDESKKVNWVEYKRREDPTSPYFRGDISELESIAKKYPKLKIDIEKVLNKRNERFLSKPKKDKSGIHLDEFVALSSIRAIAKSKKIMSSQITALGLLTARKKGRSDLIESVTRQIKKSKDYHLNPRKH